MTGLIATNGRAGSSRLVVVGDALLDQDLDGRVERICPDAPAPVLDQSEIDSRPGGAGLAAALAARLAGRVTLITAIADDAPGEQLTTLLGEAGVEVVDLGLLGATPVKCRVRCDGQTLVRIDSGRTGEGRVDLRPDAISRALGSLGEADAVLVSDYGGGLARHDALAGSIEGLGAPVVWDPHPRGAVPLPGATVVTPNSAEAAAFASRADHDPRRLTAAGTMLARRWRTPAVCITRGAEGALLVRDGRPPLFVPAEPVEGDPCGAGDSFASELAGALGAGMELSDSVLRAAKGAGEFVANGGPGPALRAPAIPSSRRSDGPHRVDALIADPLAGAIELGRRVRASGGTVVATGGCFDLIHAGHVHTLKGARGLGDCLVVCLNSDDSISRLKGSDRPLIPEEERAAILRALDCVDEVVVFHEPTPARVLERIRPDLWAKGGDYEGDRLPESRILEQWGGETVVLPFVEGRSTTRLIEEAAERAAS
jgi:D-beta-D-heptose 7-phosphate kinase / D-beta-D-heptose 1-phosphate adenosyltransferase